MKTVMSAIRRQIFIPENQYGIPEGYYDVVELLRAHCSHPETVCFIADMME